MKEQLIQYVELLFAGAQNCDDIKQEILQNTLDRYDDLIARRTEDTTIRGDLERLYRFTAAQLRQVSMAAPCRFGIKATKGKEGKHDEKNPRRIDGIRDDFLLHFRHVACSLDVA